MALKAANIKMDEAEIADIRHVAEVYRMTLTDFIKEAIGEHLIRMKSAPYYRLTANVEEAEASEADEILKAINGLEDDDFAISSIERVTV